jgi:hypothetical protein
MEQELIRFLSKFSAGFEYEMKNAEMESEMDFEIPMDIIEDGAAPMKMGMKIKFKGDITTKVTIG